MKNKTRGNATDLNDRSRVALVQRRFEQNRPQASVSQLFLRALSLSTFRTRRAVFDPARGGTRETAFPCGHCRAFGRPLGTARGTSYVSGNLSLPVLHEKWITDEVKDGGSLASRSFGIRDRLEGARVSKRGSQTIPMTNGDARPLRRSRPLETPTRSLLRPLLSVAFAPFAPSCFLR